MKLKELIKDIKHTITGSSELEINHLSFDSRQVQGETLFFALPGTKFDGHDFIPDVINRGTKAIVCQYPQIPVEGVTFILVDDITKSLGQIASIFYDHPSGKLKLVGVTGTNGKTTTATLLYKLFKKLGYKVGLLSTIAIYIDDNEIETTHTTPDILTINNLLMEMLAIGCEYCFMEVSSHAVVQGRVAGLKFAGGIFSNITRDHLDYHKTFEEYIKAKKGFFDNLDSSSFALTNIDDRNGKVMVQSTKAKVKTYALSSGADFMCKILEHSFNGMLLKLDGSEIWVKYTGRFNAYNLLAVYSAARLLDADKNEILTIMSALDPVSGRFETIPLANGAIAVIDYAHTPDALINVLKTINDDRDKNSNLITVVGCGGNRDKGKRPEMARIAADNSNRVILTSDNPRFEKPENIIDDMKAGLSPEQLKKTAIITDRREAIRTAYMFSSKNDIILIAGKGHENYQEIEGIKHHFDDKEEIKNIS